MQAQIFTRRTMLASGLALAGAAAARAQAGWPASRVLAFEIQRGGKTIGHHTVAFKGDAKDFVVAINAAAKVTIGFLTVYQYQYRATETWAGGRFSSFESHTLTNGKPDWVSAARSADGVLIKTAGGSQAAPPAILPLTHWNQQALSGPLFDFQTGKLLRESVVRQTGQTVQLADSRPIAATRYALSGDLEITDWYDAEGDWAALRTKAVDGSLIDYRRT